jgi:GNAT superfamily N-acetyltransferase
MDFVVRKITKSDFDITSKQIKSFYNELINYKEINSEKIKKTFFEFSEHPEKGCIYVFEYNREIIGYSILIYYWSNEYSGNIIFIDEFYITTPNRKKKFGTAFLNYLIENKIYNLVAIQAEVSSSNIIAKTFFKNFGFKNTKGLSLFYEIEFK